MKAWLKENLGLLITIVITAFYLMGIMIITDLSEYKKLDLNEKGDLLAGIFSPLAFLWLVYGYLQQGQELKNQVKELKNSIDEQKRLIRIYEDEQKAKHFSAKPFLIFNSTDFSIEQHPYEVGDDENGYDTIIRTYCSFYLSVENKGELAKQMNFRDERKISFWKHYEIHKNQKEKKLIELNHSQIEELEKNNYFSKKISIQYFDQFGKEFSQNILCEILYDPTEEDLYLVCKEIKS